MKIKPLWVLLPLSIAYLATGSSFFSSVRVWTFAPFLSAVFHRVRFLQALWVAAFCGLLTDLTSSQYSFGTYTFVYTGAAFCAYGRKRHFFEDKPLPFCLYAGLTSFFLSLLLILRCSLFDNRFRLPPQSLVTELGLMPLIDILYAFVGFLVPPALYDKIRKAVRVKKLLREKSL